MPVIADLAVEMLMQVTADDQTHIGSIELAEQLRPNRCAMHAGLTTSSVGYSRNRGLCRNRAVGRRPALNC